MEFWVSKDMTKEIREAEEFRKKQQLKEELIKKNLNNYLNIITKENYEQTKLQILEVIKDDINYQFIFTDILFHKVISERNNIEIYAQLIKELDKELSHKVSLKEGKEKDKNKKSNSIMRKQLLDKSRNIFLTKNDEAFDECIREKDPEKRKIIIKRLFLRNVYFITVLIKTKILSKKIIPVLVKNLFERFKNSHYEKLKIVYRSNNYYYR